MATYNADKNYDGPTLTVRQVRELSRQHGVSGFPVLEGRQVVGIVTNRDLRFETRLDAPVRAVMTPRERLVWVREGSITLSWAADGAGGTAIQANPTPPPTESPLMVLTGYSPSARQLYITTSGAARGSIWLFE